VTDIGQEFTLGAAGRFCRLICCFQFLRLFPIAMISAISRTLRLYSICATTCRDRA